MKFSKIILLFQIIIICLAFSCRNKESAAREEISQKGKHHHHSIDSKKKAYVEALNSGRITIDTMKSSPLLIAKKITAQASFTITYSSPGVKGRVIWGGLVPYNRVWVSGAHQATRIKFTNDVEIKGQRVPAGRYALFTIPGERAWIIILNKNYAQHLTDEYDVTADVLRIEVTPIKLLRSVPRLTYLITEKSSGVMEVALEWEKVRVSFPLTIPAKGN